MQMGMNLRITEAVNQEIPIVHRIMRIAFEEYRDRIFPLSGALREEVSDIREKIKHNGGAIIVWNDEAPVGSAQYFYEDHHMYIGRVSVIHEARGYGIGKQIMEYLEYRAKSNGVCELRIEVRLSIPHNLVFYGKLGFEVLEQYDYPEATDSCYLMNKRLCDNP